MAICLKLHHQSFILFLGIPIKMYRPPKMITWGYIHGYMFLRKANITRYLQQWSKAEKQWYRGILRGKCTPELSFDTYALFLRESSRKPSMRHVKYLAHVRAMLPVRRYLKREKQKQWPQPTFAIYIILLLWIRYSGTKYERYMWFLSFQ